MFYKLSIIASNNPLIKRVLRKLSKITLGKDITNDTFNNALLVKKYAPGKSFADIGALWGINGANTFIAIDNGAKRSVAVDVYEATQKFTEENKKRNSKVEFIKGDINLKETTDRIGVCDVVLCAGVLYHTPDPVHMLLRLRAITGETLILNTASIPEVPGIRNVAVFYPFLDKKQRGIWDRGIGSQKAITGPYEPEEGYGNWFWGMTPSVIESMLQCAGFEVVERSVYKFRTVFVCKAVSIKFTAESGEWNTPKDPEYAKFKR